MRPHKAEMKHRMPYPRRNSITPKLRSAAAILKRNIAIFIIHIYEYLFKKNRNTLDKLLHFKLPKSYKTK